MKDISELFDVLKIAGGDEELKKEIEKRVAKLEEKYENEEFRVFLSGPYDRGDAYLSIYSGAGGLDAQDWAQMLLRMYQRYFDKKEYKHEVVDISYGEEKGIKEATAEVRGHYAYGFLKSEAGVHRLVRISPYSAQKLRHTSFALVEVLPKLDESIAVEINEDDLRVDTFRSSGPGGQNVNKRDTAVRVTHITTGISAASQNERSQATNKNKALELLRAKLYAVKLKEQREELAGIKGESISAEWGSQIRSYVLHPYQQIKDHRTGVETSDVNAVLNGELDLFIDATVKRNKTIKK